MISNMRRSLEATPDVHLRAGHGYSPCFALRIARQGHAPGASIFKPSHKQKATMKHKYQNILETIGNTPVVRIKPVGACGCETCSSKIEAFQPAGARSRTAWRSAVIEAGEKGRAAQARNRR